MTAAFLVLPSVALFGVWFGDMTYDEACGTFGTFSTVVVTGILSLMVILLAILIRYPSSYIRNVDDT